VRIDVDPKARAVQMVLDNRTQLGEQQGEGLTIMRVCQVAVERVEEPERGIRRVVETVLLALVRMNGLREPSAR
jgi:hypothetical protein